MRNLIMLAVMVTFSIIIMPLLAIPVFADFKELENKELGFSINYPENWVVKTPIFADGEYPEFDDGSVVFVYFYDDLDFYNYSIDVTLTKNDKNARNNEGLKYLEGAESRLAKICDAIMEIDGYECSNFVVTNSQIIKHQGLPAYKITRIWTESYPDGIRFQVKSILVDIVDGKDVWTINGVSYERDFPFFANTLDGVIATFSLKTSEDSGQIPEWVRGNMMYWYENKIGDHDFIKALQGLINYKIIQPPETSKLVETPVTKEVPSWIKNNAKWLSQGLISDEDFLQGIQFLISNEILVVDMENVTEYYLSRPESPRIAFDKDSYAIGEDAIITIIDFDLNKNSTRAEQYDLNTIQVKFDGNLIGTIADMNPAIPYMRETGSSTPVFQNVIEFTEQIGTAQIQVGDKLEFEYSFEIDSVQEIISATVEIVS